MCHDRQSGGDAAPTDQESGARERAYRAGGDARAAKQRGEVWQEPHFPLGETELAQAWLEGWADMDAQLGNQGERP